MSLAYASARNAQYRDAPELGKRLLSQLARLATFVVYLVIFWCLLGTVVEDIYPGYALFILLGLQAVRLCLTEFTSSFRLATGISFLVLYAVYGPNLYIFGHIDPSLTISMFIIFVDLVSLFSDRMPEALDPSPRIRAGPLYWGGLAASCIAVAFAFYYLERPDLGLMLPLGCALFFQEGLLRSGQRAFAAWIICGIVELSILTYAVLWWGGFGRLGMAAYFIMPFALLSSYHPTKLKFWHLVVVLPALLAVAAIVRGGSLDELSSGVAAGVTDHMRLTEDLRTGYFVGGDNLRAFLDQYVLFFFNWVPRDNWPAKPIGDGLTAVDLFWGRQMFSEDYSVSLGFVGDQIFTIGHYYLWGLAVMLATLIGVRRMFIRNNRFFHKAPLVAFDATLLTYFWGGMAAFGSRAWFSIIPMVVLSLVSYVFTSPSKHDSYSSS